jgi:hypothetical protein
MSYREENGQVILSMSREDYDALLIRLGIAAGWASDDPQLFWEHIKLLNRLNEGNPHYTPYYQVEAKK